MNYLREYLYALKDVTQKLENYLHSEGISYTKKIVETRTKLAGMSGSISVPHKIVLEAELPDLQTRVDLDKIIQTGKDEYEAKYLS